MPMLENERWTQSGNQEAAWERLERLDWHLWVLAVFLILVLGSSLLSFMFPSVFWFREDMAVATPQRAFFGFCILLSLVLVYLLQRQATVRRLRRQLFEAQTLAASATREASLQSFHTLPTLNQFRDALAMEYRRASSSGSKLAVVLFTIPKAPSESLGQMARILRSVLRQGEILCRISDRGFGIILPGMELKTAASFATQTEELLGMPREDVEVLITTYPEEVNSLAELEHRLQRQGSIPLLQT